MNTKQTPEVYNLDVKTDPYTQKLYVHLDIDYYSNLFASEEEAKKHLKELDEKLLKIFK